MPNLCVNRQEICRRIGDRGSIQIAASDGNVPEK